MKVSRKTLAGLSLAVSGLVFAPGAAKAAPTYWNLPAGGSWNTAGNWNPATVPNADGANATFNNDATANNPAQTGNRAVTLDGAQTIGSLVFNNDVVTANAFTTTISTGSGGSLTFKQATGAGPATISVPAGKGTGNNTISAPMTLSDSVVAQVDNTATASATGALNLTGTMSGAGGFTKNGDGLMTFGTGTKTYTGPTIINGGRTRMSNGATPSGSAFTINAGGQVELISSATYTFGGNTLNLNGNGATTGPFSAFGGAIRPTRAATPTITAPVNLQSDTVLHMQATSGKGVAPATTDGAMTFTNTISGPGKLTFTAANSDIDQGYLILTAANTYTGGTLVQGGILQVTGAGNLGTGNVTVDNAASPVTIARMQIVSGVVNAINDNATLSLAGGGVAGAADRNFAILDAGVNETVGGLILGGVTQTQSGTYGSVASGANFQSDEFFSGTGVITLGAVPEPATLSLLGLGALAFCGRRRRK
jgi:autotransporter-associated beta strand protein